MAKSYRKNALKILLIALVVIFLVSASLFGLRLWENQRGRYQGVDLDQETVTYQGTEYVPKKDVESFLVLGLDKFEDTVQADSYNNDQQADFLMLLVFDKKAETYSAVHLNRDTMALVNVLDVAGNKIDTVEKQIALSHTYGNGKDVSCRNTADSVSALLLGVDINHYLSMTMDSVAVLNDLVGGVEVTVQDDFSGIDDTLIQGQTVLLKGEQALRFVRSRQGLEDSSNQTRMARQQQYLDALRKKFSECVANDTELLANAAPKLSGHIVSDRSIGQLQDLAEKMNKYQFLGIRQFEGELKTGEQFLEFYPQKDSVEKLVIELFYQKK